MTELNFTGFHVSGAGVLQTKSNVEAMISVPEPQNVKQLRSFIISVEFYQKFIPNFSAIAESLCCVNPRTIRRGETNFLCFTYSARYRACILCVVVVVVVTLFKTW